MKLIKRIFFGIAFLIILCCGGILVCALNPSLTAQLAGIVNATGSEQGTPPSQTEPGQGTVQSPGTASGIVQPGVNSGWLTGQGEGYVAPGREPVAPPDTVGGRGGYEPVREDLEEIPGEEADNLSDIIATGELGEEFAFDSEFYPYYAMLEPAMQQLYRQIYANAQDLTTSFTPAVEVTVDQVKSVFEAVYNDHPELFWLETGYSCKYLSSGRCVEITLKYNGTIDYLDQAKADFAERAEMILSGARGQENAFEQEKYVHDALMEMVEYSEAAALNQSAYSALVQGESVCAGYARAFQYLMQQLGIPCYYCTGTSGEDHAWNIIKLDNVYYNVDVTWDDTEPATYDYFNKSDADFAGTHVRTGLSVYLPACGGASDSSAGTGSSQVRDLINENPQEPLRWESRGKPNVSSEEQAAQALKEENLEKAGITEEQVLDTMEEYYADCLTQLKEEGVGEKQFTNCIPESLWPAIEKAYSNGEYWKGYVEGALKELKAENFAIQLQAQRLGGGYYRLYHTVYIE